MVTRRLCAFIKATGESCKSPPLNDSDFCRMHSPEHMKEVQEARRLGGLRLALVPSRARAFALSRSTIVIRCGIFFRLILRI